MSILHEGRGDVLVVDDQIDSLRALSELLSRSGYRVRKALNPQAALTAVSVHPPDLILLDITMPVMSGYDVCERLKRNEHTRDIPVIFVSALDDIHDKSKAFEMGGNDYITKPFQAEEVLMRVSNQLTLARQRQTLMLQNTQLQREIIQRQQAEAKYRSIFENATEGIFQTSPEGQYLSVNPALAKIYGYDSPQELIESIQDVGAQLYVVPGRRDEIRAYLQEHDRIMAFDSEMYRKDGQTIWVSENCRAVRDSDGNLLYYEGTVQDITARRQAEMEVRQQRAKADRLLHSILPYAIAQRLKDGMAEPIAKQYDSVTVLFADLVNFTASAAETAPASLLDLLNQVFSAFDYLTEKYGLEKIKTIGDEYMVAAGLPEPMPDHAIAAANLALDMQTVIQDFSYVGGVPIQLRIGLNTGPVVAGVIGTKKFTYDLWGDTVNVASRMESTGLPNRIQVPYTLYPVLKHAFVLEERGLVTIKGRGEMMTYWLEGRN